MTWERDIYASANLLIQQHKENAELVATQRMEELAEDDDLEGVTAWLDILLAIDDLRKIEKKEFH